MDSSIATIPAADLSAEWADLLASDLDHVDYDAFASRLRSLADAQREPFARATAGIDPRESEARSEFLHEIYSTLGDDPERFGPILVPEFQRLFDLAEKEDYDPRIVTALEGFEGLLIEPGPLRAELVSRTVRALGSGRAVARRFAARMLEDVLGHEDRDEIALVVRLMDQDDDWRVRANCFAALAHFDPMPMDLAARLQTALCEDPDERVRLHACWVIQFMEEPGPVLSALERGLRDPASSVRRAAYRIIRRRAPERKPSLAFGDLLRSWFSDATLPNPVSRADLEDAANFEAAR